MSLEQLMENPYAWLILSVCSILSFAYAIYMGVTGKEKKEISYIVNTYEIVRAGRNMIPGFQMSYCEHAIDDLTVTRFTMWNSGNRLLTSKDIVDTKPLSIMSNNDGPDILDVSIIKQSEESNEFVVDKKNHHSAELKFDYMDKRDGIILQILHTGLANDLVIDGKIKGGKKLKNVEKNHIIIKNKKLAKNFDLMSLCGAGVFLIFIALGVTLDYFGFFNWMPGGSVLKVIVDEFNKPISSSFESVVIIDIMTVIISFLSYRILKDTFHLGIPAALRDKMEYND